MGHPLQDPGLKRSIIGEPLHPVTGDDVLLVEGRKGNPVVLDDDKIFVEDGTFYLLVAAEAGKNPQQVAELFRKGHQLTAIPSAQKPGSPQTGPDEFAVVVDPSRSFHYLDRQVAPQLRFRPDLEHLKALYGDKADYFMIGFRLPYDRERMFGREFRTVRDEAGRPTGENINTRIFDLQQSSIDGRVEVIYRGGLALFDRQDPDGRPDNLHFMFVSDLHVESRNDELEGTIIEGRDQDLYFRFNNANANLDAIVREANQRYWQGRLDFFVTAGDNINADGIHHGQAGRLMESNNYHFARAFNNLVLPAASTNGNHDEYPEQPPAAASAKNYHLTANELRKLEEGGRYDGTIPIFSGAVGIYHYLRDSLLAVVGDNSSAQIGYYDLVDPFPDSVINFGRGDPSDPDSREFRLIRMDMGRDDLAHFREDDPIYRDLQIWPWGPSYGHFGTTYEALTQQSPDLYGPNEAQLSWWALQAFQEGANILLVTHPPSLNSEENQVEFDPKLRLSPLRPVVDHEDLGFNTFLHGRDTFLRIVKDSPCWILHLEGHTHFEGNGHVIGTDRENSPRIYRGQIQEGLHLLPKDGPSVRTFWEPPEVCDETCAPQTRELHQEAAAQIRNPKYFWQVGSSGVGDTPVLSILTIHPNGFPSDVEHHWVIKQIEEDPNDPNKATVRRVVSPEKLSNDRLAGAWKEMQRANPRPRPDWEGAAREVRERLDQDDISFLPNPDSLRSYPVYNDEINDPIISPTKLTRHLRPHLMGNSVPWLLDDTGSPTDSFGASVQYFFSRSQVGKVTRTLFLEGAEIGWFQNRTLDHHGYLAVRSPHYLDWKIGDRFILRGLSVALGGGVRVNENSGDVSGYLHDDLTVLEPTLHFDHDHFEIFLGLEYHRMFNSDSAFWVTTGAGFLF